MLQRETEDNYPLEEDKRLAEPCMLSADISLEDQLANIGVSFHDILFELIDESHIDNKDVWKRAIVYVEKKEYFAKEDVPLPIEKTKHIIRKCTEEEVDRINV